MTAEMTATSPHSSQNKNDSHSSGSRQTSKAHANSRSAKISGPDHCMVINLDDIGQCSSSQTSPKPEQVIQKHRGSEFLGWIATAPLAMTSFAWALKQIHGLNDLSPAMGMISNSNVMLSSQLWYFAILFAEYNMKVSPTVNTLIEADYVYGTHDKIAHIKQSEAVRLETHMACRKETSKGSRKIEGIDEGGHEIIWQGKTAFPIGCIIDATDTSGKLLSHKAVVLESSSRMEFVDEKTKLAFESVWLYNIFFQSVLIRRSTVRNDFIARHILTCFFLYFFSIAISSM